MITWFIWETNDILTFSLVDGESESEEKEEDEITERGQLGRIMIYDFFCRPKRWKGRIKLK